MSIYLCSCVHPDEKCGPVLTRFFSEGFSSPPALEDEYQACAHRREEKENVLNDAQAELAALVAEVERHTHKLSQLDRREEEAKLVPLTHPDMISQLREKSDSAQSLFTLTTTTTTVPEAESMDTSQLSQ